MSRIKRWAILAAFIAASASTANAALTFKVTDTSGGGSVVKCNLGPTANTLEVCAFDNTSITFSTTSRPGTRFQMVSRYRALFTMLTRPC